MMPRNQTENCAGIYLIRHLPSGALYVGQATDVRKRWQEHKKQLKVGRHHNKGLQVLWRSSDEDDFMFEIVEHAPSGLSALQLQRWLVKQERRIYVELKERGMVLNEAEPEIVATIDAVKEYRLEEEERTKRHDNRLSAKRCEIKMKAGELERQIAPQAQYLSELRREYLNKSALIKNSTGWRRLFHGRPSGFNLDEERNKLEILASEINRISPNVSSVRDEISRLREEYRCLRRQFTKVADRKWSRTLWYGLGRIPSKPKITE